MAAAVTSRAAASVADAAVLNTAASFVNFVDASPSPFHVVASARAVLEDAGYEELSERTPEWVLNPGGKYFFTRNQSALVAFACGGEFSEGCGFNMVAAHTDSPCLKVKPVSKQSGLGYEGVGVETYGGGLWHTWFDRDLSVAGRVLINTADGGLAHRLVKIDEPILRIPTLAIHLDRSVRDGFKFNTETHLTPILCTTAAAELSASASGGGGGGGGGTSSESEDSAAAAAAAAAVKHSPVLLQILANKIGCAEEDIRDFELCLYDTQNGALGGPHREFIFAPRLDNQAMSYAALQALVASTDEEIASDKSIRMIVLFDNEEIGSTSEHGADSNLVPSTLARVYAGLGASKVSYDAAIRRSFLISADMAHALHPNYVEKHEKQHRPAMHEGPVLKYNANQRYATTAVTATLLREVADRANVPLQDFVVRNDSPCGSTIGPMSSAHIGVRTVDIGAPQLSMHSIREMCGTVDLALSIDLLAAFFRDFTEIDEALVVDK